MRILSLGINDITQPVDGLPMYLSYFDEYCTKMGNKLLHINLIPNRIKKDDGKVEIKDLPISGNRVINVYSPFLFFDDYSDVYKYIKAVGVYDRALIQFKPDIIFMHDWMFVPVVSMFKKKTPIVYFAHLFNIGLANVIGYEPSSLILNSETIGMNKYADVIICNSESEMNDINEKFPQTSGYSYWVHLGVDKQKYDYSPAVDSNVVLYLGRLDPQKGIAQMLEDFGKNEIKLKELGLELWIAGDGYHFPEVAKMHFNGQVKYLGQLRGGDKIEVIKKVKYMIFPSVYEPYGLSLNEGLSMGKICVATNVGGHAEQIKNNKNGFLVKDFKLFEKIIELENKNKKQLIKVMKMARETANNIEEHFKTLWRLLNEVL